MSILIFNRMKKITHTTAQSVLYSKRRAFIALCVVLFTTLSLTKIKAQTIFLHPFDGTRFQVSYNAQENNFLFEFPFYDDRGLTAILRKVPRPLYRCMMGIIG